MESAKQARDLILRRVQGHGAACTADRAISTVRTPFTRAIGLPVDGLYEVSTGPLPTHWPLKQPKFSSWSPSSLRKG